MKTNISILIFGVGTLQQSLIERCRLKGLFTVGIDPNPNAECKKNVDVFEVVDGNDFEATVEIAQKYNVSGVITAATDKPLHMMARVAEKLNLPFFSVETAKNSTDKMLMKEKFMDACLSCAKGFLVSNISEFVALDLTFPVIVKPRDNSGSRGVIYCENLEGTAKAVEEALMYTKKGDVLVEEFIEGQEYSIEGIHYNGKHHVIQFTEKKTTDFPYNVEITHVQPAEISTKQQDDIRALIAQIGQSLGFDNCASHTELKINSRGIFIIETSPRLGGDFISSTLVPLSTGINMEDALIDISIKSTKISENLKSKFNKFSGVQFFQLPIGFIKCIGQINEIKKIKGFQFYKFDLAEGQRVSYIKNSIDRYGYSVFQTANRFDLDKSMKICNDIFNKEILIEQDERES